MAKTKYIAPSFDEADRLLTRLARKIWESGFRPDIIVGISSGGLIPTAILSDRLGLESEIIGVKYYRGIGETREKPEVTHPIYSKLEDKRVLVVDDVADTGNSLQLVKEYIGKMGAAEIRVCTIHYKPKSIVKPEYFIKETEAWIIYPWEVRETLTKLTDKLVEELGTSSKVRIRAELRKRGIPKRVISEF